MNPEGLGVDDISEALVKGRGLLWGGAPEKWLTGSGRAPLLQSAPVCLPIRPCRYYAPGTAGFL